MNGKTFAFGVVVLGGLLVAASWLGLQPGTLIALVVGGGLSTWRSRKQRARDVAFWSMVWQLRQVNVPARARMLAELEPEEVRIKVQEILAKDGSNDAVGDIEQFPFPRSLRRIATRRYWSMWVLSLGMLATAALISAPTWLRCIPLLAASCCAYGAWAAAQRERLYDSTIEITPFRVGELFPDGQVRTVLFSRYLELHNEPQQKRLRLSSGADDPGIVLDFRRMGFDHLVDLIIRYGDFRPDGSAAL